MAKRYWLNKFLDCPKRGLKCPKCKKWMKCIEKFVRLSHSSVDADIKDTGRSGTPTQTEKKLNFSEKMVEKPNKGLTGSRKGSKIKCTANTIYVIRKASRQ